MHKLGQTCLAWSQHTHVQSYQTAVLELACRVSNLHTRNNRWILVFFFVLYWMKSSLQYFHVRASCTRRNDKQTSHQRKNMLQDLRGHSSLEFLLRIWSPRGPAQVLTQVWWSVSVWLWWWWQQGAAVMLSVAVTLSVAATLHELDLQP